MIHRYARPTRGQVTWLVAALAVAAFLPGCGGSAAVREKSAQEWYDEGTALVAKKKYDDALNSFRQASKGYRGADLDAEIQMALADTSFRQEEYPAAVEAYTEFLRLHPHNPRADYAQLRIGQAWGKQLRDAERSQEASHKAAEAFEALLRGYPRSSYLEEGRAGLTTARRRIAEHELSVADFYLRTRAYRAAAGRFELVLKDYADLGFGDRALYHLARCYEQLKDADQAARLFEQLRREYPQSQFVKELDDRKG